MDASGLKVLMISNDRNICLPGSAAAERMKQYGTLLEELHIVLLSDKSHKLSNLQLDKNVWVNPTNSLNRFLRPIDAARLGKGVVLERKFVRGEALITAQDPFECGWVGLKVKRRWRLPLEVQMHTDPFSPYFQGLLNLVRKMFMKKVLRNADSVRVVSTSIKDKISGLTKASIKVLPIYVDKQKIEEWKAAFDLHAKFGWPFIILTVSRLAREKNLSLALEILKIVRDKYKNVGLVIVGSGPEEKVLKSKVKSLKLDGAVVFEGWQENLTSYYKTSNLYLQTSLYEGYGLALVEAGLSGLPIVTTPVGIATELESGKDAYIYPPTNPSHFARGIIDLIENNHKRELLRVNAKNKLETKVLSKTEMLQKLKENWERTAKNTR